MLIRTFAIWLMIILFPLTASAADITLRWDATPGATGYKIHVSNDGGNTWLAPNDVGNVLQKTITGVAEDKMVLFRVGAYNSVGESIRYEAGAWFDFRKKPPAAASGTGIQ